MKIDPDLKQLSELLSDHQETLLAAPPGADPEETHASWVFQQILGQIKAGQLPTLLIEAGVFPQLKFLPQSGSSPSVIHKLLPPPLRVKISLGETRIKKIDYAVEENQLNLVIHAVQGKLSPEKIRFEEGHLPYTLLVALGIKSLAEIKALEQNWPQDQSSQPIVNIDFSPQNTLYGTINLIYTDATCLTELVLQIVKNLGISLNTDLAQVLMSGLVLKTRCFSQAVTPGIFRAAASLSALGAQPQTQSHPDSLQQDKSQEEPLR